MHYVFGSTVKRNKGWVTEVNEEIFRSIENFIIKFKLDIFFVDIGQKALEEWVSLLSISRH